MAGNPALADARSLAYTAKLNAETERIKAETLTAEAAARVQILYAENKEREVREALAIDRYHHLFRLDDDIDALSVGRCIDQLTIWRRLEPGCPIEIQLTSPGGSIIEGLALFDFLRELSRAGHTITTSAYGFAASMAGILLQAGDIRVMARESWLMIHEPKAGVIGSLGQMNDRIEWMKRINERVIDIFYDRSRDGAKKLTRKAIADRYNRKDWWISAPEALELGFIDEVR